MVSRIPDNVLAATGRLKIEDVRFPGLPLRLRPHRPAARRRRRGPLPARHRVDHRRGRAHEVEVEGHARLDLLGSTFQLVVISGRAHAAQRVEPADPDEDAHRRPGRRVPRRQSGRPHRGRGRADHPSLTAAGRAFRRAVGRSVKGLTGAPRGAYTGAVTAPLTRADLDAERTRDLSTQSYTRKPAIEGVRVIELRRFTEDGGSFCELLRVDGGRPAGLEGFEIKQVNYSDMEPARSRPGTCTSTRKTSGSCRRSASCSWACTTVASRRPRTASRCGSSWATQGPGAPDPARRRAWRGQPHREPADPHVLREPAVLAEAPDEHRLDTFMLGRDFWQITAG